MRILVSVVSEKSNTVESSFEADADKYFNVNKDIIKARAFVANGATWEGVASYGTYLRIVAA